MKTTIKSFELQVDLKPSGAVIRINDENGCVFRMCRIPKKLVFEPNGEVKKHIDITYPKQLDNAFNDWNTTKETIIDHNILLSKDNPFYKHMY